MDISNLRQKWIVQKAQAKHRGINFSLTFEQWLEVWEKSGHLRERGCHKGRYVMARPGDLGAYETGNVVIVLSSQNCAEGNCGPSPLRGRKLPTAHCKNISAGMMGHQVSAETRAKISAAKKGKRLRNAESA
jgi:hypothetical protein